MSSDQDQGAVPGLSDDDRQPSPNIMPAVVAMISVWIGLIVVSTILGLFASRLIGNGGRYDTPALMVFVATFPLGVAFLGTGSRNWAAGVAGLTVVALSAVLGSVAGEILVAGPLAHLHWLLHFVVRVLALTLLLLPGILALLFIWRVGGVVPKDTSLRQLYGLER